VRKGSREKVELIDVVIATSDEVAHEATVCELKRSKTPNIKRLYEECAGIQSGIILFSAQIRSN
jgi:hypothetical protein